MSEYPQCESPPIDGIEEREKRAPLWQSEELIAKIEAKIEAAERRPAVRNTGYHDLAREIADLLEVKQGQYGDSVGTAPAILALLYPDGVRVEQYADLLTVVRMLDKLKRVATSRADDPEDPWVDLAGYAILRLAERRKRG